LMRYHSVQYNVNCFARLMRCHSVQYNFNCCQCKKIVELYNSTSCAVTVCYIMLIEYLCPLVTVCFTMLIEKYYVLWPHPFDTL
jgi:hypothetical protein